MAKGLASESAAPPPAVPSQLPAQKQRYFVGPSKILGPDDVQAVGGDGIQNELLRLRGLSSERKLTVKEVEPLVTTVAKWCELNGIMNHTDQKGVLRKARARLRRPPPCPRRTC